MKKSRFWSWLTILLGGLYFFVPLYATLRFSLMMKKDVLSFMAYEQVIHDPKFLAAFSFSAKMAILTILVSLVLIVPTAYWVHLRLPKLRPVMEFITMLPFVIPAIVLVFGLIRSYSKPPLLMVSSPALLVAAYVVLSLPYMYRAVDVGLRAIDVRALTEAAQSLGAGWPRILFQVIFPNLRSALLGGTFLTFAIVIGELTVANSLAWKALGPYMTTLAGMKAYEPAALAVMSFILTWVSIILLQFLGKGRGGASPENMAGMH
jgi:putative spermidine/putrescine transport system permease protein